MSNVRHVQRVMPLLAIMLGFALGLAPCLTTAEAGAPGADFSSAFQQAFLGSFGTVPEAYPDSRLTEPFGLGASPLSEGGLLHKWLAVTKGLRHDQVILEQCRETMDTCPPAAKRYLAVIDKAISRDGRARIAEINRAINLDIRPLDDMTQYGTPDTWATPLMTFASGAGDCEDYAIAKYVALREAGIAAADLRIVVVHDRARQDHHAVAAVRHDGRWLILDNRTLDIQEDIAIANFDPLFVLDSQGARRMVAWPGKPPHPETLSGRGHIGMAWLMGVDRFPAG